MSIHDLNERFAERHGAQSKSIPEQLPRLPDWLLGKVLEHCGGQPGDPLMAWLETHQHNRQDVSRWHTESNRPNRECGDSDSILRSGASLVDHQMRHCLGKLVASMVYALKPQHEAFLPPDFIRQERV